MSRSHAHIVTQISSVASVGEKWLTETFFPALSITFPHARLANVVPAPKPKQSIIFPTAAEIRNSIDGYSSGGSIHMKSATAVQQRQVDFIRPMLCHWSPQPPNSERAVKQGNPHRHPAAPHIKTYVRFKDTNMQEIEWAMLTSANLSTQAWGREYFLLRICVSPSDLKLPRI